jgi:hypothetical protein
VGYRSEPKNNAGHNRDRHKALRKETIVLGYRPEPQTTPSEAVSCADAAEQRAEQQVAKQDQSSGLGSADDHGRIVPSSGGRKELGVGV